MPPDFKSNSRRGLESPLQPALTAALPSRLRGQIQHRFHRDENLSTEDETLSRDGLNGEAGVTEESELRSQVGEDLPDVSAMRAVASLKAEHPIALADCFAIALAAEKEAVLMTGDPEIVDRAKDLPCEIEDLRPSIG